MEDIDTILSDLEDISTKGLTDETNDEDDGTFEIDDHLDDGMSAASDSESETIGKEHVKKRKMSFEDDEDDRLDDEDYELLDENLGIKVKKRFKRVKQLVEDSDDETQERVTDKDAIAIDLFDGSDNEDESRQILRLKPQREYDTDESESENDDFIVDDEDMPICIGRERRRSKSSNPLLKEAQDVFGIDFDYDEIRKINTGEVEIADELDDDEEDSDGTSSSFRKKEQKTRRKSNRKSLHEVYEPSELERMGFTEEEIRIRNADVPERFQLRWVPIEKASEMELEEEAEWIHDMLTMKLGEGFANPALKAKDQAQKAKVGKIRNVLDCIKNQNLDIPFIFAYRKEQIGSGNLKILEKGICDEEQLLTDDLWDIYYLDAKFCQLKKRRGNLHSLFCHIKEYQDYLLSKSNLDEEETEKLLFNNNNKHASIEKMASKEVKKPSFRKISEDDLRMILGIKTPEELEDFNVLFNLHYSDFVEPVKVFMLKKTGQEFHDEGLYWSKKKLKVGFGAYAFTKKKFSSLNYFASIFGLTPTQFGENLKNEYQRNEVEQYSMAPRVIGKTLMKQKDRELTIEEVFVNSVFFLGTQMGVEPLIRQAVRDAFYSRATFSIRPTPKGRKEIDETSPLYPVKYLTRKPVNLLAKDEFLRYIIAEENKLIELTIDGDVKGKEKESYLDEMKDLFFKDEYNKEAREWNDLRSRVVTMAFEKHLVPALQKELRAKLLRDSKDYIMLRCQIQFVKSIELAPYRPVKSEQRSDKDWDCSNGVRVMAISYGLDPSLASFVVAIDKDGEPLAFLRLKHLMKSHNSLIEEFRRGKEKDLKRVQDFIEVHKPHVIVIGGDSVEALNLQKDLVVLRDNLAMFQDFPDIQVEIIDSDISRVIGNSNKFTEFPTYSSLLKEAISLGRRIQNPLLEVAQLMSHEDEILCVKFHPLQEHVCSEDLLHRFSGLMTEWVSAVGVNINDALRCPRTAVLLNFVAGLGPRKAKFILRTFQASNAKVDNRALLITKAHIGPVVFVNCAGFIRIPHGGAEEETEFYNEPLDSTRIHPETYDWARKMAVDALDYDDEDEDVEPTMALEEIRTDPTKLNDLDLDAFGAELERQGFGSKRITLQDIRYELIHPFAEIRKPYKSPDFKELFRILTKETPESLAKGKLVRGVVVDLSFKKKQGELMEDEPKRTNNMIWYCGNCFLSGFTNPSQIWEHFDKNECPGRAWAVRIILENGLRGFIPLKFLSDKSVENPWDRVKVGQLVTCRIMDVNIESFSVFCGCSSSILADIGGEYKASKDDFYDEALEGLDLEEEENQGKKKKGKVTYTRRVIIHPCFMNIPYSEAENRLATMEQGDLIIRPSSKGSSNLTLSWKVTDKIVQHVNVKELEKENVYSLGRKLMIEDEEFEDLDEIIARHVNPMAGHARELISYKYYQVCNQGDRNLIEAFLRAEQERNMNKSHYVICPSSEFKGKFYLSYLPSRKVVHEFISVTPDGLRYRGRTFGSLGLLLDFFKLHYTNAPPNVKVGMVEGTPSSMMPGMNVLDFGERSPGGFSVRSRILRNPVNPTTPAMSTPGVGRTPSVFKRTPSVFGRTPVGSTTPGPPASPVIRISKQGLPESVLGGIQRGLGPNPFNLPLKTEQCSLVGKAPTFPSTPSKVDIKVKAKDPNIDVEWD